jgi:RNA polymerase sigma factor (sigma-70 family)
MTDKEKILKLRTDRSYFTKVYNEHKGYTIRFLKSMNDDVDTLVDLYQDAMIVLYEKVQDPNFQLTCSIQTYLNSICRNQLLNKFRQQSKFLTKSIDVDVTITDWFPEDQFDEEKEERISLLENALEQLKRNGEKCYEMLVRFFYQKQSLDVIAKSMGYTNGDNVKNQKSRCQKKLKEIAHTSNDSI